jgi:glycosyltransferase involved in cell wall biosynthesis
LTSPSDQASEATSQPGGCRITVVVPVYNDPAGIETTLTSLLRQDYSDFEIIVADNDSSDETRDVAAGLAASSAVTVKVIVEPKRTSYAARNAGMRAASGSIIAFIDADMSVPPNYLASVARCYDDPSVMITGALVSIVNQFDSRAALYNTLTGFPIARYFETTGFLPTNCLSIRRSVVNAIGPFDERLESGGDREFTERVRAAGFRGVLLSDVHLSHPARTSLAALARKSHRSGRGIAQLIRYYPERYSGRAKTWVSPRGLLPLRPRTLANRAQDRGVHVRYLDLLIMMWIRPVLRLQKMLGYWQERRHQAREADRS